MSQSLFARLFSQSVAALLVIALIVSTIPVTPVAAATDTIGYTNKQANLYKFVNKKLKAVKTVKKNMTFFVLQKMVRIIKSNGAVLSIISLKKI